MFVTTDRYFDEKLVRDRLAIRPIDNIKGRHITAVQPYRIPKNTMISEGTVGPKDGYRGGGMQIVIENPPDAWKHGPSQTFKAWRESAHPN